MNSKQQGDIGVAAATLYYTKLGYVVSYPLTDNARYDLVVDRGGVLTRIQCKTSTRRNGTSHIVQLATSGGNRSWTGVRKNISQKECDIVFVWCDNGSLWEIPTSEIDGRASFHAGPKNIRFLVEGETLVPRKKEWSPKSRERKTKIVWPELEELEQIVDELGYVRAGKRLGVSDNAIRKHIKRRRLLLVV